MNMNIRRLFSISRTAYQEVNFQALLLYRHAGAYTEERIRKLRRSIRWQNALNKLILSVVIIFITGLTFGVANDNPFEESVTLGTSLLLSMFIIILYNLPTVASFLSGKAFKTLTVLPLSAKELKIVSALIFIRFIDAPSIVLVGIPTLASGLKWGVKAALPVLTASLLTLIFSMAASIYLSSLFYRFIFGVERSLSRSLLRFLTVVLWGLAVMSLGWIGNLVAWIMSYVSSHATAAHELIGLIFPYQFMLIALHYAGEFEVSISILLLSVLHLLLGLLAGVKAVNIISKPGMRGLIGGRVEPLQLSINVTGATLGVIKKDFRVASRSPSHAYIFAVPIYMFIIMLPTLSGKPSPLKIAAVTGLLIFSAAANGLYLLSLDLVNPRPLLMLPISWRKIVLSKALFSTASAVPIAVFIPLYLSYTHGLWADNFVPLIGILTCFAVSTVEMCVILRLTRGKLIISYNPFKDVIATLAASMAGLTVGSLTILPYILLRALDIASLTPILLFIGASAFSAIFSAFLLRFMCID